MRLLHQLSLLLVGWRISSCCCLLRLLLLRLCSRGSRLLHRLGLLVNLLSLIHYFLFGLLLRATLGHVLDVMRLLHQFSLLLVGWRISSCCCLLRLLLLRLCSRGSRLLHCLGLLVNLLSLLLRATLGHVLDVIGLLHQLSLLLVGWGISSCCWPWLCRTALDRCWMLGHRAVARDELRFRAGSVVIQWHRRAAIGFRASILVTEQEAAVFGGQLEGRAALICVADGLARLGGAFLDVLVLLVRVRPVFGEVVPPDVAGSRQVGHTARERQPQGHDRQPQLHMISPSPC